MTKTPVSLPKTGPETGQLSISPAEFQNIRKLAYDRFGLNLLPGKEGLVIARLSRLLRGHGFTTVRQYHSHLLSDRTGEALIQLIDALTTNHTFFLREPAHFDFLAKAATSEWKNAPQLRLWCCAASTGEEPYGLVMTLLDAGKAAGCRWTNHISLLATDISTRVLAKAEEGTYDVERCAAVPPHWWQSYLTRRDGQAKDGQVKHGQAKDGKVTVRAEVRRMVKFSRLNLIEHFNPGMFQTIFCRNVMIYFDRPTQQDIVSRLVKCLEPGGYLFIGHSESLTGYNHNLQYVRPAVYRLPARGSHRE